MTSPLRDAAESATAGVPVVRQQAAVAAFRQVLADVEHKEQTNTRNPGTDYRARQFFVEHGPDFLSELDTARAEIERLREALAFYRDGFTFITDKRRPGLAWVPTETLLDDCGNIARATLSPAVKEPK